MLKSLIPIILLAGLLCSGCSRSGAANSKEAVESAVMEYLGSRPGLDLKSLDVQVSAISFRQGEADATVTVSAKGAGPANSMEMRYVLESKGDKWVVKGRAGGSPHGGAPPQGSAPGGGAALPPGHPPTDPGAPGAHK